MGRAALPLVAVGAVLSGLALYLQEYVVPEANNRVRVAWWDEIHTQGAGLFRLKGMQIPIGQGKSLYFQDFDMAAKEMVGVRITAFQGEVGTFLFAERGTWEDKTLTLKDYRYYQVDFAQVPGLETAPDLLAQVRRVFRVVSQGKTLEVTSDLSRARAIADYADTFSFGQDSLSEAWRKLKDPFLPPLEKWRARLELHSKLAPSPRQPGPRPPRGGHGPPLREKPRARPGDERGPRPGLLRRLLPGPGPGRDRGPPPELGAWGANLLFLLLGLRALR